MVVQSDRIEIDPRKCHGRPVIQGTRVPVSIVTGSLAGGMSMEEVAREYDVTLDDIRAALGQGCFQGRFPFGRVRKQGGPLWLPGAALDHGERPGHHDGRVSLRKCDGRRKTRIDTPAGGGRSD